MLSKLLLSRPQPFAWKTCIRYQQSLRKFSLSSSNNVNISPKNLLSAKSNTNSTGSKSKSKTDFQRLFSYAKSEKRTLVCAVGLLSVSSFATIVFPFIIGKTIDTIYSAGTKDEMKEKLNKLVAIVGGLVVVGGLANYGRVYLINIASQRITNNIRRSAHAAIMRQEVAFFDHQKTGQLLSRLSDDASQIGNSLTQNISDGLRSGLAILGGTGMMIYTSPQLSLVGLSIVPPVAMFAILYGKKLKAVATQVQSKLADSSGVAEEQFSNIRTVRMFTKENLELEKYSATLDKVLLARTEEAKRRAVFFGTTGATGNIVIMSVLYYGGMLMAEGHVTVGSLSSFLIYAAYVGISMGGMSTFISETMKAMGASTKLWSITDRQPTVPLNQGEILDDSLIKGSITFENVSFRYPTRDADIIHNLNLSIPAGKVTAIVGPSGSGKSTLAGLVLRLYDTNQGKIYLDGNDILNLNATFLRNQIGVVAQEPVLFSASIKENIAYGSLEDHVAESEIIEAAKYANAWEFIKEFPEGLETLVGERGVLLSGGQKQRIAIARAILRKPKILILDEATSSLDAISEKLIQDVLEKFSQGRTVIVIAHRLSTIKRADNIVVLKSGEIAEQGTFDSLLQIDEGVFRTLVMHQMR